MMPTIQHLIGTISALVLMPLAAGNAQTTTTPDESTWIGVVTTDSTTVRCGANESYYPIAAVKAGDFVQVHGKRQDWLKIETVGSVFEQTIGYIKYPTTESSLCVVTNGHGVVKGDVEVLANNIDSEELYRSWRPVLRLHDGDEFTVVDSIVTEPGTLHREAYIVHTITLPSNATAWINSVNVTPATPEQTALFTSWKTGEQLTPVVVIEIPEADVATEAVVESTKTKESNTFVEHENETVTTTIIAVVEEHPTTLIKLSLAELEAAWEKISTEPVMGAEVSPLRDMYFELLTKNEEDLVIKRIAGGRVKQLEIWAGLQEQRVRIEQLRADLAAKSEKVSEYQTILSFNQDYVIVGKLALSHTFDGRLRPFMYRIQDKNSGRTLGYLPVNKDWELSALIGQTIGIKGENKWDPNWRVNVVNGNQFDILSPTTATVPNEIQ